MPQSNVSETRDSRVAQFNHLKKALLLKALPLIAEIKGVVNDKRARTEALLTQEKVSLENTLAAIDREKLEETAKLEALPISPEQVLILKQKLDEQIAQKIRYCKKASKEATQKLHASQNDLERSLEFIERKFKNLNMRACYALNLKFSPCALKSIRPLSRYQSSDRLFDAMIPLLLSEQDVQSKSLVEKINKYKQEAGTSIIQLNKVALYSLILEAVAGILFFITFLGLSTFLLMTAPALLVLLIGVIFLAMFGTVDSMHGYGPGGPAIHQLLHNFTPLFVLSGIVLSAAALLFSIFGTMLFFSGRLDSAQALETREIEHSLRQVSMFSTSDSGRPNADGEELLETTLEKATVI